MLLNYEIRLKKDVTHEFMMAGTMTNFKNVNNAQLRQNCHLCNRMRILGQPTNQIQVTYRAHLNDLRLDTMAQAFEKCQQDYMPKTNRLMTYAIIIMANFLAALSVTNLTYGLENLTQFHLTTLAVTSVISKMKGLLPLQKKIK